MLRRLREAMKKSVRSAETEVNGENKNSEEEEITLKKKNRIRDLLEPLSTNWQFIEDVLLWKNQFPACVCFLIISGLFWKFLALRLRKFSLVLSGILLVNAANGDLRTSLWNVFQNRFHLEIKEENSRLPFSFDELCFFIAYCWTLSTQHVEFVKNLKSSSSPKFYSLVAVYLFTILTFWTYIPVAEILYLTICLLFFYPSLRYFGVIDKLRAKFDRLSDPVVVHWEHNQTKRARDTSKPRGSEQMESDDEFALERSTYTSTVLSSAVPAEPDPMQSSNDSLSDVGGIPTTLPPAISPGEFTDDDDNLSNTNFERGLSMPSLSQFDSIMEPYDEFHYGLKFPNHDVSLRTLPNQSALDMSPDQYNSDDEIDDLPFDDETDGVRQNHMFQNNVSIEQERVLRHRIIGQSMEYKDG